VPHAPDDELSLGWGIISYQAMLVAVTMSGTL